MTIIERIKSWITDHDSPYAHLDITEIQARMAAIEREVGRPLLGEYIDLKEIVEDFERPF